MNTLMTENASMNLTPEVTLSADWLDTDLSVKPTVNAADVTMTSAITTDATYLLNNGLSTNTAYWYGYSSRIRLTFSEVNKLRAAAKKDKALKAILQKFTPHIELVVDFD